MVRQPPDDARGRRATVPTPSPSPHGDFPRRGPRRAEVEMSHLSKVDGVLPKAFHKQ